MKKSNKLLSLVLITSLLSAQIVFANPVITSTNNQSFDKNQSSEQLYDMTITQDGEEAFIESGYLKLILPDSVQLIYNDERTINEFIIYGTAVDNGKVLEQPDIIFSDDDKELWIPIIDTFLDTEYMVVTRVFVEGFNSSTSQSDSMVIQVNDEATTYMSDKYFSIKTSTNTDTHEPEEPTNVVLTATETGVEITWDDPSDLDLQIVEILRGVSPLPVDGKYYALVGDGEEYYLDEDLEEGDVVSYILRASDGLNYSDNTDEYTITYSVPVEEELLCEEGYEEGDGVCVEIEVELECEEGYEAIEGACIWIEEDELECEEGYEAIEGACIWIEEDEPTKEVSTFSDTTDHWGEVVIDELASFEIIKGDDEGTFRPDDSLNRAEAATLMSRLWDWLNLHDETVEYSESAFNDVYEGDWYYDYIMSMNARGILQGNPDGSYEPAESINRAEFLQLSMNLYSELMGVAFSAENTTDLFADLDESEWYASAVAFAANEGWVAGSECDAGTCFYAANEITRAEATQVLHNMFYELLGAGT